MKKEIKGVKDTSGILENMTMGALGFLESVTDQSKSFKEITTDLAYITTVMVNICFFGEKNAESGNWTLIDAGLPSSGKLIEDVSEKRFGKDKKPSCIILTHGHFDHVGALKELIDKWDVKIYAHKEELPYLTGKKSYPDGAPLIDQGLMAKLSPLYPHNPIDLGDSIHPLPDDNSIPGMKNWKWIHTPGHTPGHISLFREKDGLLIAGDAFTTADQESLTGVLSQEKDINTPPAYYTPSWKNALSSIEKIQNLNPKIALTGHGKVIGGNELREKLDDLYDSMKKNIH